MVLVDSTVWIDLLRERSSPSVMYLRELLELGEAAIAPVILQEVLQGASSATSLEKLKGHFSPFPLLEPQHSSETYVAAATLYARCRWQGLTPRSPHDCLISCLAVEHGVFLLHNDRDFELLARFEPALKLI